MKKSKLVLIILFTLIVGIGLGAGAATLFSSDQVLYKDTTTVKGALDDLYSKTSYGNATAAQILKGKTALVGGSKITGSMTNLSSSTPYQHTSSNTTKSILGDAAYVTDLYNTSTSSSPGKYVEIRYNSTPGYITANTLFAVPQATMASAIGLTADKLVSGNTILGIAGSIPSRASSGNVKGDKAWPYENRMYFGVDYGYYPKANFGGLTDVSERYITYSSLARDIGLTAAKIAKGNTILGIAGTYTSPTGNGCNNGSGSISFKVRLPILDAFQLGTFPTAGYKNLKISNYNMSYNYCAKVCDQSGNNCHDITGANLSWSISSWSGIIVKQICTGVNTANSIYDSLTIQLYN